MASRVLDVTRRITAAVALLGLYTRAVLWITWPLGENLATHLPDTHIAALLDGFLSAWVLAYESHTLATSPWRLPHANIYHPTPYALFYGVTGFGVLPYFAPVFLWTGNPTLALNVAFLGCLALTALTLHLVVRWWTGSHLAGAVAGGVFLTNRFVMWSFVPTAPVYAALQYFPLIIYFAATFSGGRGRALCLMTLVALQCLTDMVYVAPAVLAPLGCLALWRLARSTTRRAGVGLVGVLALTLLVLAPFYVGYWIVIRQNPRLWEQSMWRGSDPPLMLPEGLLHAGAPTAVPPAVGGLIVGAAVSLLLRWRRGEEPTARGAWAHGALWAAVGVLVSLTPIVFWHGVQIPTPQLLLSRWIPALQSLRSPKRLGIGALMGIAVLGGVAFAECARRLHWRGRLRPLAALTRAALVAVVLTRLYAGFAKAPSPLPSPYPLIEAPQLTERLLAVLRAGKGPVLEVPVQPPPVNRQTRAMYHSIFHWRPILNGYGSYWPAGFPERMALATALPDPAALATLVRETGVTTILVHTHLVGFAWRAAWLAAPTRGHLRLAAEDGYDLLFEVIDGAGAGERQRIPGR